MRDKSAIEIGADETNRATHRYNLGIDFTSATSNGFDDEICLRASDGTAAKRLARCVADGGAKVRAGRDRFLLQGEDRRAENFSNRPDQEGGGGGEGRRSRIAGETAHVRR